MADFVAKDEVFRSRNIIATKFMADHLPAGNQALSDLNIFYVSGSQFYVLSFIFAIVIALVAQPFYEKAQYWIDILFYRDN